MNFKTHHARDYEYGKKYEVILTNYLNQNETDKYDLYPGRYIHLIYSIQQLMLN